MAPEVFFTVVHGTSQPLDVICQMYTFRPAVLHDYCRYRVKDADYPAILPKPGASVRGVIVSGLTDANMDKLDTYEGCKYSRDSVRVRLLDTTAMAGADGESREVGLNEDGLQAWVYVFLRPWAVEQNEWDFEHFRKEKLHLWSREDFVSGSE